MEKLMQAKREIKYTYQKHTLNYLEQKNKDDVAVVLSTEFVNI